MSAAPKHGYWIIHINKVHDMAKLREMIAAASTKTKRGGVIRVNSPVTKVLTGDPVVQAVVVEFPCLEDAMGAWDDMEDYGAARAILGDPESNVVERRVCVLEADPLPELKDGAGLWINLVEKVLDEDKFMSYVGASMPNFTGATFGPVVHQHVGDKQMQFAAVLTFESIEASVNVWQKAEYIEAKKKGTMEDGEEHVVVRTIACVEYKSQNDDKINK